MLSASPAGTVTMAMSTRSLRQNSSSSCTLRTRLSSPDPKRAPITVAELSNIPTSRKPCSANPR